MGRPTKLTPETQQLIIQSLSVGATHRLACQYAGIDEDTFYTWMDKGHKGHAPYAEFAEQVKKTEGRAATGWLAKIEAAANEGNWQAAAWKLERRYPNEYGRQIIQLDWTTLTDSQLERLAKGENPEKVIGHANGHRD